ncbi:hypothetical protein E2C01_013050 [Portunus trituberculatus]|uniref:Uncharacterized protein n=1 Tax=Portunus trituberculatus TaxID=210409 RepID=A0A5B7DFM0_PORTR|nr:hypothetical protein [Portunus trituberculatus]
MEIPVELPKRCNTATYLYCYPILCGDEASRCSLCVTRCFRPVRGPGRCLVFSGGQDAALREERDSPGTCLVSTRLGVTEAT